MSDMDKAFLWRTMIEMCFISYVLKASTRNPPTFRVWGGIMPLTSECHSKTQICEVSTCCHLQPSIYVNDVVCGARNEETAYHLFLQSKQILWEGGINSKKLITNSKGLQYKIDHVEGTPQLAEAETIHNSPWEGGEEERKELGVRWDVRSDK